MARLHGKAGSVTFAGGSVTGVGITSWTIDYKSAADETTGMDSSGAKTFIAGLTEWSGSFSGYYDTGKIAAGTTGSATFYLVAAGANYAGTIIVTSFKVDTSVDGPIKITCDFQGTGTLT